MQHNVCDAQKSLCDASKGAREPDAESGCVMWPSCCTRRWRFIFYLEDCRRFQDRFTWFGQVCFRAFAADHGSRKLASGKVQRHLRGCCHLRRSAVDRSRHSGHDILSVDSMEGVKKSQRYHGRAQEVHRSGQSRRSVGWLAPRHRVFPGGAANVYSRFLIRSHPRRSGRGYTAGA